MAKKPNYSEYNIPALQEYCEKNKIRFRWKNQSTGHAILTSRWVELDVWVQRMTVQVRKRYGYKAGLIDVRYMKNQKFDADEFTKILWPNEGLPITKKPRVIGKYPNVVAHVTIPEGTPEKAKELALEELTEFASSIRPQGSKYNKRSNRRKR